VIHAEDFLGAQGHGVQQVAVGGLVGDFVVDDELVLLVDADLNIVGDIGDLSAAGGHGAAVRIGEGDLGLTGVFHLLGELEQLTPASLEGVDLLLKLLGSELRGVRLRLIAVVEIVEVGIDLLVEILELPLELALGDVAGAVVGGLELAAVDGDELAAKQVEVAAEQDEGAADLADGFAIVFAKVGDGLEVRGELAQEPNQLQVAAGFPFQQATGADRSSSLTGCG